MKARWSRLKKPMLWTLLLTALSLLLNFLFVRYSGVILTPVTGDFTPYLRGLSRAAVGWDPLLMPLSAIICLILLCIAKKHFRLTAVLAGIILLFAGLLLMRVNGVPLVKMISVLISLINGGAI